MEKQTKNEIFNRVRAIVVEKLGVGESEVTKEASFTHDLGADSLDVTELFMEIERGFAIEIPADVAEVMKTVDDVYKFIIDEYKN